MSNKSDEITVGELVPLLDLVILHATAARDISIQLPLLEASQNRVIPADHAVLRRLTAAAGEPNGKAGVIVPQVRMTPADMARQNSAAQLQKLRLCIGFLANQLGWANKPDGEAEGVVG